MADELDRYLSSITGQNLSQGPAPVTSGAGTDELDSYLNGIHAKKPALPGEINMPASPDPAGAPVKMPGEEEALQQLDMMLPRKGYTEQLGDLFMGGVNRNLAQFRAMPPMLHALYADWQGDEITATQKAREAIAETAKAGESQYSLPKIHDMEDFSYWLTEKLGENAATTVATLGLGTVTGLTVHTAGRYLLEKGLISKATEKALTLGMSSVPTFALTGALETAGTGSEIYEATGQLAPKTALTAGTLKGALEIWTPLSLTKSLLYPGSQFGMKSFVGGVTKTAFKEGATELAQEAIDITARKMLDPNYNFFDSGTEDWLSWKHQGLARLAEAGAAGFATGAVYGAPFVKLEQQRARTEDGKPVQAPGDRAVIKGDPSLKETPDYVGQIASALQSEAPPPAMPQLDIPTMGKGPISTLRDLVFPPGKDKDLMIATAAASALDDLMGLGPILRTERMNPTQDMVLNLLDRDTPRYVIRRPDGKFDVEVMTDTEATLHNVTWQDQATKPAYHRVDPGSLSPAGITARVQDLSEDVWFLPDVPAAERQQMMQEYQGLLEDVQGNAAQALWSAAGSRAVEQAFRPQYEKLVNRGLRVVPSRGAGFYYSGVMKADPEDITKSSRDKRVGFYNPETGQFRTFRPSQLAGMWGSIEDQYKFTGQADLPHRGEIPVSIDFNKIDPSRIDTLHDGSVYFRDKLDLRQVTPGVDLGMHIDTEGWENIALNTKFLSPDPETQVVNYMKGDRTAQAFEIVLKKLAPKLDAILRDLGIDATMRLIIQDRTFNNGGKSAGWVHVDTGVIGFNPNVWTQSITKSSGNLEIDIYEVLMHELGHQITGWYWTRLPLETQTQLIYAWEKANLARRMDAPERNVRIGDMRAMNPLVNKPLTSYYLGFSEWLAEQFRRWASIDPYAANVRDSAIKGGAQILDKYYKAWETRVGKKQATNLRNPDYYFTAFMQYLQVFGDRKMTMRERMAQHDMYYFDDALMDSPVTFQIVEQVEAAIVSMLQMFPAGVKTLVQERLNGEIGDHAFQTRAQAVFNHSSGLPRIELALAAIGLPDAFGQTRMSLTHELMHVLEVMGLITKDELAVLDRAIATGPDPLQGKEATYRQHYTSKLTDDKLSEADVKELVDKYIAQERRAFYLQEFANSGLARDEASKNILARILEVLERIKNFMAGIGYQSRDDVLRAIFRGEIARRNEGLTEADVKNALRHSDMEAMYQLEEYMFDKVEQAGPYTVGVAYDGGSASTRETKLMSKYISYIFFDQSGREVGFVDLKNRMPKGFEIEMINTKAGGFGLTFNQYIEQDLGIPMKLAGILLEDGFQQGKLFARKRMGMKPEELGKFYQPVVRKDGTVQYYSPNKTREMVGLWTRIVQMMQTPEGVATVNRQFADVLKQMVQPGATNVKLEERMTQKRAIAILASWKAFEKRFPPEVWTSPALDQMFQLEKTRAMDGIQGAAVAESMEERGNELLAAVDGTPKGKTALQKYEESLYRYKVQTAAEMGLEPRDVGAPQVATMQMLTGFRNVWRGMESTWHSAAGTHPGRLDQHLVQITRTQDRMNAFWKWALTIYQLAKKNLHIPGLQSYVDHGDIMKQIAMRWVRRAEETARAWERLGSKQREAISKALFDLTEMRYRDPGEVQNKVVRLPRGWVDFMAGKPPQMEVATLLRNAGVSKDGIRVVRRVARDFADFLTEVEGLRAAELQKTFARDPVMLQKSLQKLASEMAEFRNKPYFPMMRFGQFTIVVRDSTTGKIIAAYAYDNQVQRDAAVEQVARQFPGDDLTIGRASEAAMEFMGLPGPLLRIIRQKMKNDPLVGLTAEQEAWLEEFELINGPDTTFAKRWMPSQGTPGYSLDGFRAYSQYFMSGSRYISRLAKMDDMKAAILEVEAPIRSGQIPNYAKRQMIVDYMKAHYKYIMEPGQDSGKLRAFVSLWYLGGSVTAAAMNFMQIPTVTIPYLSEHFGKAKAYGTFNTISNVTKNTARTLNLIKNKQGVGSPQFLKAREEAISQGIIDVGQAAELGAFAEGHNLHKLLAGDKVQKLWRNMQWYGMWMFGAVEAYNRELTFNMAWKLAMENPKAPAVAQIDAVAQGQIVDLQARTGMTWQEAVSFLYAKQAVNDTQFIYDKSGDAPFMRGKKKDFLIFFKFTQNFLFTLGHSNASTKLHILLLMLLFYGFQGLPGSEDLNELLKLIAKKRFGKDFDLHMELRKFVRGMTAGTVADKFGPDLFMHGITRYSMGPALFTEHYFPQFDVSANGSMGRIIPGMAELMHGMATDKKFADVFAESAQKASGAAYGMAFPLMKWLMEPPGTADSKKWEALLPRFAKGFAKAWRHGFSPGAETDSTGAKLVGFDITDPGDAMTVITTALGAQPRKVNEIYEMARETRDLLDQYQARRVMMYAQLDKAIQVNDVNAIIDVTTAMNAYNKEVDEAGYPTMSIKIQQVVQSLKQRNAGRVMQENFLARNRSQIPVTQKMMDLWPGIAPRNVK